MSQTSPILPISFMSHMYRNIPRVYESSIKLDLSNSGTKQQTEDIIRRLSNLLTIANIDFDNDNDFDNDFDFDNDNYKISCTVTVFGNYIPLIIQVIPFEGDIYIECNSKTSCIDNIPIVNAMRDFIRRAFDKDQSGQPGELVFPRKSFIIGIFDDQSIQPVTSMAQSKLFDNNIIAASLIYNSACSSSDSPKRHELRQLFFSSGGPLSSIVVKALEKHTNEEWESFGRYYNEILKHVTACLACLSEDSEHRQQVIDVGAIPLCLQQLIGGEFSNNQPCTHHNIESMREAARCLANVLMDDTRDLAISKMDKYLNDIKLWGMGVGDIKDKRLQTQCERVINIIGRN